MKEDVERREKAQAEVIAQQVWRPPAPAGWPGRRRGWQLPPPSHFHCVCPGVCWNSGAACPWGQQEVPTGLPLALTQCCTLPGPLGCPQAKRLEELDALYRDEAIMRKKIFNQVRWGRGGMRELSAPPAPACLLKQASVPPAPDGLTSAHPLPVLPPLVADGGHEGKDPGVLPRAPHPADGEGPRADRWAPGCRGTALGCLTEAPACLANPHTPLPSLCSSSVPLAPCRPPRPPAEAVQIPDELTIALQWKGQKREWSFDSVFGADTPQEKVFEDTKHLIQSAVDGYNVCIFACGWRRGAAPAGVVARPRGSSWRGPGACPDQARLNAGQAGRRTPCCFLHLTPGVTLPPCNGFRLTCAKDATCIASPGATLMPLRALLPRLQTARPARARPSPSTAMTSCRA